MSTQYDPVAERYEQWIVPKFRPVAEMLLQVADPQPTDAVLDLAAGTGGLARLIAALLGDGGRLVVSDISSGMLDVARRVVADAGSAAIVEVTPADVTRLPFGDAEFDLVVGQMTPVQDMPEAIAEALRVLRPGGRLALAFWGPSYTELDLLNRARERAGLPARGNTPPADVAEAIANAGFANVDYEIRETAVEHASADDYVHYRDSFGRPDNVDDELWNRYWNAAVAEARELPPRDGSFSLTWSIVLLTARRPS